MIVVGIYVLSGTEYNRLDLFNDENISITSAIQDANDISKTKTDFSQSFTVPANENNNKTFKHWYENSIDNGYDARIRKQAYITLDTKLFRNGKVQLEKVSLKDGLPQSYTLTFFGSLVSLKDTFNGLFLSNLDSQTFDFSYSESNVVTRVTTQTTNSVKFPLITSNRVWNYGSSVDVANNIAINAIAVNELFPALKIKNILDLIGIKFGIQFTGTFINSDERFLKAYMWLKNTDAFKVKADPTWINYQTSSGTANFISFDLANDQMSFTSDPSVEKRSVTLNITSTTANVPYTVYCYKDNAIESSVDMVSIVGAQNIPLFTRYGFAVDTAKYSFRISQNSVSIFTSNAILETTQTGIGATSMTITQSLAQATSQTIKIANYFPLMKIEDFFTGILKMFNLVCYSEVAGVYILEQLETYYIQGGTKDISEFVISDTKNVERTKPYNKINFEHEKSESYTNVNFAGLYGREFGDLAQSYGSDGGEYNVKIPFETLLFSNLIDNLQVGYSLKTDFKSYIPKPIIIYDYGVIQSVSPYKLSTGTYTTYNAFGNETSIASIDYSMTFGAEQSSLRKYTIPNTLYSQFYQNYLNNIYSVKGRIIKVSAILPNSYLIALKLNTKIVISGKRYIINSFDTKLITGVVEFELINDFRDVFAIAFPNNLTTDDYQFITTENNIPITINT